MPRIVRIVIPHYPHHVTQRGNRRQRVFFNDEDYIFYKKNNRSGIEPSSSCAMGLLLNAQTMCTWL
jgi:hypothetical protein|tara:strand:- start:1141 stop:1338 length:198 start_codon:yes stop_codon:yes gene_type:complete